MILLRHGQSAFNLAMQQTGRDPGIPDPELTEHGHGQAQSAARALAGAGITRILVSPYRRALQTATPIAAALGVVPVIDPLVRERAWYSCDIGSPPATLAADWPSLCFRHLDDTWWGDGEESEAALQRRCAAFRDAARGWPDQHEVLVVSHWGFILGLTGTALENGQFLRFDP